MYTYIYIYVKLNDFAVHQKLTEHCKLTILQLKNNNNSCKRLLKLFFITKITKSPHTSSKLTEHKIVPILNIAVMS